MKDFTVTLFKDDVEVYERVTFTNTTIEKVFKQLKPLLVGLDFDMIIIDEKVREY